MFHAATVSDRSNELQVIRDRGRFDDGRAHAEAGAVVLLGRSGPHLGYVSAGDIEQRYFQAVDGLGIANVAISLVARPSGCCICPSQRWMLASTLPPDPPK